MRKRLCIALVLSLTVMLGGWWMHCGDAGVSSKDAPGTESADNAATPNAAKRIPVVTVTVQSRDFYDRIAVQGNLKAATSILVPPRVGGVVEKIFVDKGDAVEEGRTPLFQIEAIKLQQAVEIARQQLNSARLQLGEREIALDRTRAELNKSRKDLDRYEKLYKERVVSLNEYERVSLQHTQVSAGIKSMAKMVALGRDGVRQAEAALAIAEKDLGDALVKAPATGIVTQRFLDPGAMAGASTPVVQIEDLSRIKVACFLPYQTYAKVQVGKTPMRVAIADRVLDGVISYKSPTIHPTLRTYEVECVLVNPPEGFTAGALAEISVLYEKRSGLGVPRTAVQTRDGRSVVFVVEDDKAKMIPVSTGLETDGWLEVRDSSVAPGQRVVSEGQFMLDDGTPVLIQAK